MAPHWQPHIILDVDPASSGYTCVGTVVSGRRCLHRVNMNDRSTAAELLTSLETQNPTSITKDTWVKLALLCLCKQVHRKKQVQLDNIVAKWERIIKEEFPATTVNTPVGTTERSRVRTTRSSAPSSSARSGPERSRLAILVDTSATTPVQPVQSSVLITPPTTPITTSTPSQPRLRPSAQVSTISPQIRPIPTPARTSTVSEVHHTCDVVRKPITEDCGICYEPIHHLKDAVWCRASCGQNVHRECFNNWRKVCLSDRQATGMEIDRPHIVKCIFCRQSWID